MARLPRSLLAVSFAALAACATKPDPNPPTAELATGTFTTGLAAQSSGNTYPFSAGQDVKWETLYVTSEVGGSGLITGLRMNRGSGGTTGTVTCPNTTIRLGHTTIDPVNVPSLSQTFAQNVDASSLSTVFSGTVVISAAAGDWFDLPLSAPWAYNGVENLLVEVESLTSCSGTAPINGAAGAWGKRRVLSFAPDLLPNDPDHSVTTAYVSSPDTTLAAMQFVFRGGDRRITFGAVSGNAWPFANNPPNGLRTQNLYLASELQGSGAITAIGFELAGPSYAATVTTTVRMAHTDATVLTTTFASNAPSPVTVAGPLTFHVPASMPAGSWLWVPLSTAFSYDGVHNLVIEFETPSAVQDGYETLKVGSRPGARAWANGTAATAGNVDDNRHHLALRFHGAPVVFHERATTPFRNAFTNANQAQVLFAAGRHGISGTITRVGLRMGAPTTGSTLTDYEIYLGQTAKAAFVATDTFGSNMDGGGLLAFKGTLTVPGGMHAGDWLDVPLQAAFQYDGSENLVVMIRAAGGTTGTDQISYFMDGPYAGLLAYAAASTGLTGTPGGGTLPYQPSVRFFLVR